MMLRSKVIISKDQIYDVRLNQRLRKMCQRKHIFLSSIQCAEVAGVSYELIHYMLLIQLVHSQKSI